MRSPYDDDSPPPRRGFWQRNPPANPPSPYAPPNDLLEDTQPNRPLYVSPRPAPQSGRRGYCGCCCNLVLTFGILVGVLMALVFGLMFSDEAVERLAEVWQRPTPTIQPPSHTFVAQLPTDTQTPTPSPTATATPTAGVFIEITEPPPSATPSHTATRLPTLTPSDTPSITPTPSDTLTLAPTLTPQATDTPRPTDTPPPTATGTATRVPPSSTPSTTPSPFPSRTAADVTEEQPPSPAPTATPQPSSPSEDYEAAAQEADLPDVLQLADDSCAERDTSFTLIFQPRENLDSLNILIQAREDGGEIVDIAPFLPDTLIFTYPMTLTVNNFTTPASDIYPPSGVIVQRERFDTLIETVRASTPLTSFALDLKNTAEQPRLEFRFQSRGSLWLTLRWARPGQPEEISQAVRLC